MNNENLKETVDFSKLRRPFFFPSHLDSYALSNVNVERKINDGKCTVRITEIDRPNLRMSVKAILVGTH